MGQVNKRTNQPTNVLTEKLYDPILSYAGHKNKNWFKISVPYTKTENTSFWHPGTSCFHG